MPATAIKTPKGQQTRSNILETALGLFQERGYDQTTMRAIATEAGVSLGNAYYYFASKEVLIAKHWVSEAGNRIVHAAAHLHGGVGVDREYPLHRFFLYARQLQLTLGASTPSLVALGRLLAEEAD